MLTKLTLNEISMLEEIFSSGFLMPITKVFIIVFLTFIIISLILTYLILSPIPSFIIIISIVNLAFHIPKIIFNCFFAK